MLKYTLKQSKVIPVTAVFDIGKTNKKFLLYDKNYSIVNKQQSTLVQTEDEDGYPCEDLEVLTNWITNKLDSVLQDRHYEITSLNFSTYGASLVHLDEQGQAVTPLYNYLKPYPEELLQKFYHAYGGQVQFSLETASPPLGMLNSGLQLYWLKHQKPHLFDDIQYSLHFPQYLSYLFTGKYTSECTSVGCHTILWNYERNNYHQWLKKEDMLRLLPDTQSVYSTSEISYKDYQFDVGIGIHDSSAALAPYLHALDEPFMLLSTGTWSIAFNPFNSDPLTYEELQKDCLCYLNVEGQQVKASRLFLGNEYSHQRQKLDQYFERESMAAKVELDVHLLKNLIKENDSDRKLKLETAHNSGPYPEDEPGEWRIEKFSSHKEAYHQLMLDLVAIQADCIELARGSDNIDKLIITGGFSQNEFFVKMLASRFPEKKVYTTSLPHASALGAALVINDHSEDDISLKELLDLKQHAPLRNSGIEQYSWKKPVTP